MSKIAVFRSLGRGYDFGFGRFTTALAVCWLPYALIGVAAFFLLIPSIGSMLQDVLQNMPPNGTTLDDAQKNALAQHLVMKFGGLYRQIILYSLICMFLRAMIAVGLTRASVGLEEKGFFYFSLSAPVWNLFLSWIATFLIVYAVQVILAIIAVIIGLFICLPLIKVSIAAAIGVGILLYLSMLCGVIYVAIRLNFFLPPIIVSEKKIDILRSWNLSEGNVWRIIGIYIGIALPFIALLVLADTAILIAVVPHLQLGLIDWHAMGPGHWEALMRTASDVLPLLPPLLAAAFLAKVLFAAMLYAATARAYRGLVATDIASQTED